jgi:protein-disulfide isomerase
MWRFCGTIEDRFISGVKMKEKSSNPTTIVVCAVIIILSIGIGGFFIARSMSSQGGNNGQEEAKLEIDVSKYDTKTVIKADENNGNIGDHVRGNVESKVVVVEYADLQCPGCAGMMPQMHKLYETYGDRVAFVFRHFPLTSHVNSRPASAAVEAAGLQGKYWEMLETLYSNRGEWISESGEKLTEALVKIFKDIAPEGDESKFRNDMKDMNIIRKIEFDHKLGDEKDNVDATPSIYVNGEVVDIDKAETIGDFAALVEEAIKAAL